MTHILNKIVTMQHDEQATAIETSSVVMTLVLISRIIDV
jgi:hypothetical protein